MTELTSLNLTGSPMSDGGLAHLKGLPNLRDLRLDFTEVTDAGLAHLRGLRSLKQLSLGGTRVTSKGVKELQDALPELSITPNPEWLLKQTQKPPGVRMSETRLFPRLP